MKSPDVIVIGSGQGAVPLAAELSKEGREIFRTRDLGGSCINYGCTPSKAFLASVVPPTFAEGLPTLARKMYDAKDKTNES
jgi:pyruvate/2-oxoglutarate dehydrogenase complex dihydrolipoamide dehydrogenase (E3) component